MSLWSANYVVNQTYNHNVYISRFLLFVDCYGKKSQFVVTLIESRYDGFTCFTCELMDTCFVWFCLLSSPNPYHIHKFSEPIFAVFNLLNTSINFLIASILEEVLKHIEVMVAIY